MVRGTFKVPGGKLLSVEFKVENGKLRDVVISGDFFMVPEEEVFRLERMLEGVDAERGVVSGIIRDFFSSGRVSVLGFSPEDLISLFEKLLYSV